jgi:hypothetical protein
VQPENPAYSCWAVAVFHRLPEHSTSVFLMALLTKDLYRPSECESEKAHKPSQANPVEGDDYIQDAGYRTPQ